VNTSFAVRSDSGARAWLVLLSVEDLNQKEGAAVPAMAVPPPRLRKPQPKTDAFALHFSGAGAGLKQGTYTLEHPALGVFDLFLVAPGGASYTAVFNRLLGPSGN
jgi:hypothetical protein